MVLARYGGLRCPSEVLSLRWQDVDWEMQRVTAPSPKTESLPEGRTVFQLPAEHPKRMRTTHPLEHQNKELQRRTRVATLFPNEAPLLRLVSAVLAEVSDEWETGKRYLNTDA